MPTRTAPLYSLSAFKALPEIPEMARQAGLKLEFCGLVDPVDYPADFLAAVRALPHFGLFRSAHGPFYDLLPPSRDPEVSALAKAKFQRSIAACQALGSPKLILHSGWLPRLYTDGEWLERSVAFWQELVKDMDEGLTIHLENVFEDRPRLIRDLVRGVDDPRFKACLDVGHVNCFAKGDIRDWIEALGPDIGHVHLHNNSGQDDEHRGLTQGLIDVASVLDMLALACPQASINLEIRSHLAESLAFLVEHHGTL
jgi:sugar phosphate isomerase/epimerase